MQIGNLEPEAAETRSKEVGAESKLSRERLTEMANAWRVDRGPSSGYLTWAGITKMLADFGAKVEKDTREQCSQEVTELIKLAASVVRREYLPNLERCRTIRDARDEISRHDSRHVDLGMKIKAVAARLRGGI